MFSSVIIFCLALCAAYYCKYKDPPAEESMEANSQNESPRILGRFVFGILFTCYMAKDCLKTFFDVVQNYEDDSYIDLISLATDHQRNEYETSDDSDGEHQYSFVEFLIMKTAVAFVICLELCLACNNSLKQNELIPDLEKKCYLHYMNLSICYLTIVVILFFIVLLKCLMDVVIIHTANDNSDGITTSER
ncbi:hypothetical protein T4B_12581 [Trichinella pseudospiralis]|uniref:Uncharacterized protein n=2 Tax=Trichinella pseudospiralis TaxID=6337 RepID=A0A0V1IDG3_TRIPS|nr:hypothetical protein T4B_12581 [Trichinella pseudospiralis]KRZ20518.1 hypothetical protein T4B_12581 [Trichinella pseudospiralis]